MQIGRASGKRTLAEQYDRETVVKRPRLTDENENVHEGVTHSSKFFSPGSVSAAPASCSSGPRVLLAFDDDKENIEELEEVDFAVGLPPEEEMDMVEQEEGYMSPSPAFSSPGRVEVVSGVGRARTPDLSSPLQSRSHSRGRRRQGRDAVEDMRTPQRERVQEAAILKGPTGQDEDEDTRWGSEDGRITSPPMWSGKASRLPKLSVRMVEMTQDEVQMVELFTYNAVPRSPPPLDRPAVVIASSSGSSEVDRPAAGPVTPDEELLPCAIVWSDDAIEDDTETTARIEDRHRIVGAGWEKKYSNIQGRIRRDHPVTKTNEPAKGKGKVNMFVLHPEFKPMLTRTWSRRIPVLHCADVKLWPRPSTSEVFGIQIL
jgi:hypothetical protein